MVEEVIIRSARELTQVESQIRDVLQQHHLTIGEAIQSLELLKMHLYYEGWEDE